VPTAPATALVSIFGSVHVSTYLEVDIILARSPSVFKMGWPNAYDSFEEHPGEVQVAAIHHV
jgi:hypothetical protein